MKDEYIIINKTALEKRIEELETGIKTLSLSDGFKDIGKIEALKQILSQSTPLIPEIEKALEYGLNSFEDFDETSNYDEESRKEGLKEIQQDYISNLKLDI
jgi:uncharacterized coiled-coil protein SlyX